MIEHSIQNGSILFSVRVVPRASRSEIIGEQGGVLRVRISAPPVDGAANEELVRVLARDFGVPRRAITILTGQAARLKRISIEGLSPDKLKAAAQSKDK